MFKPNNSRLRGVIFMNDNPLLLYAKTYESPQGTVVYACDRELLGKKITEGDLVLDVSEEMYRGDLVTPDELVEILMKASSFVVIGNNAVKIVLENALVHPASVLKIGGVPYAMFVNTLQ